MRLFRRVFRREIELPAPVPSVEHLEDEKRRHAREIEPTKQEAVRIRRQLEILKAEAKSQFDPG